MFDVYFAPGGHFWVATDMHGAIMGCVGVEKINDTHCELRYSLVLDNSEPSVLSMNPNPNPIPDPILNLTPTLTLFPQENVS